MSLWKRRLKFLYFRIVIRTIVIERFTRITEVKCTESDLTREDIVIGEEDKICILLYRDCDGTFYSNHEGKVELNEGRCRCGRGG